MNEDLTILSLPDLVLYQICDYLSNPFDLLNLGCTCSKFYEITLCTSFWWNVSVEWLSGIWICLDEIPSEKNSREWLLQLLRNVTAKRTGTKAICDMGNDEVWKRVESKQFRCYLGMLQLAYVEKLKECHPLVLYERWLYDIGLFSRDDPYYDFELPTSLTSNVVAELANLGQAKDRDLRSRKQPYIDPKYYVNLNQTSRKNWTTELFPHGPFGSKFPLLLCPFQGSLNTEVSGKSGLLMCASLVIEKHIVDIHRTKNVNIFTTACCIRSAVEGFANLILENFEQMRRLWGYFCLTSALKNMATENDIDLVLWQSCLDKLNLDLNSKTLLMEIYAYVEAQGGIDSAVNSVRSRWRILLVPEIIKVLIKDADTDGKVTRINITDSDLIGGDNFRQEMSAAAFISSSAVLVTWHLIGRTRY